MITTRLLLVLTLGLMVSGSRYGGYRNDEETFENLQRLEKMDESNGEEMYNGRQRYNEEREYKERQVNKEGRGEYNERQRNQEGREEYNERQRNQEGRGEYNERQRNQEGRGYIGRQGYSGGRDEYEEERPSRYSEGHGYGRNANENQDTWPNFIDLANRLNLTAFSHSSLKTGLATIINHEGPFTVFAPTNFAFQHRRKYPFSGTLEEEMKFHVCKGRIIRDEIRNEMVVKSLLDKRSIRFNVYRDGKVVTANGREVVGHNYRSQNGVLYELKDVMSSVYDREGTVMSELMNRCPHHQKFFNLIKVAGLENTLNNVNEPITLLAPTDLAFDKLHPDFIFHLKKNITRLRHVILTHIVAGTWYTPGLVEGTKLKTVSGISIPVHFKRDHLFFGNARADLADFTTANGAIHSIDGVLFPDHLNGRNLEESINLTPYRDMKNEENNERTDQIISTLKESGHHFFAEQLREQGLEETFSTQYSSFYTIFAPSDEGLKHTMETSPETSKKSILMSYIVPDLLDTSRMGEKVLEARSQRYIRLDQFRSLNDRPITTVNGVPILGSKKMVKSGHAVIYSLLGGFSNISPVEGSTVLKQLMRNEKYSKFVDYMRKFAFDVLVTSPTNWITVFAPNNEAIEKAESKMSKKDVAASLIGYHFVTGSHYVSKMKNEGAIRTLSGKTFVVQETQSGIHVGNSNITEPDMTTKNGVIHGIDNVLVPYLNY